MYYVVKENDFVMKKMLSIFLALNCLFFCVFPASTAFASGENALNGTVLHKPKNPRPPKTPASSARAKNFLIQKVFLTTLLCAIGVDIKIKFLKNSRKIPSNFVVTEINNVKTNFENPREDFSQIKVLTRTLCQLSQKGDKIKFEFCNPAFQYIKNIATINGHVLRIDQILKYGEKALELFYEKDKERTTLSYEAEENLTTDVIFKSKAESLLKDILIPKSNLPGEADHAEETLFPLEDNKKNKNNTKAINQKAFLTGLLCVSYSDIYIKYHEDSPTEKNFDFTVCKINNTYVNPNSYTPHYESKAIMDVLQNKRTIIKFEPKIISSDYFLNLVKLNGHIVGSFEINSLGEKISKLIYERKQAMCKDQIQTQTINLGDDILFRIKAEEILKNVLNPGEKAEKKPTLSQNGPTTGKCNSCLIAQKSFLISLLCSVGADVYVIPKRNLQNQIIDFTVYKMDTTQIFVVHFMHVFQIKKMLEFILESHYLTNFTYRFSEKNNIIENVTVSGNFLKAPAITKRGMKAFDLISEKLNKQNASSSQPVNLTADHTLKSKIKDTLKDVVDYDESTVEEEKMEEEKKENNSLNFYHDEEIADKSLAHQKAFLTALLCSTGASVYAKFEKCANGKVNDFTIISIEGQSILDPDPKKQIQALIFELKKRQDTLGLNISSLENELQMITVGDSVFSKSAIENSGEKMLSLICSEEEKKMARFPQQKEKSEQLLHNFFLNPDLKDMVLKIFSPTLPSINTAGYDRFKSTLKNIEKIESYFQKAFIIGFACAINIETVTFMASQTNKEYLSDIYLCYLAGHSFPEVSPLTEPNMAYMIQIINKFLVNYNMGLKPLQSDCKVIEYVKFKNLVLDRIDIFNLGYEFYNIIRDEEAETKAIIYRYKTKKVPHCEKVPEGYVLDLKENSRFKRKIKAAFKARIGTYLKNELPFNI